MPDTFDSAGLTVKTLTEIREELEAETFRVEKGDRIRFMGHVGNVQLELKFTVAQVSAPPIPATHRVL